jgi:hypothetical protein
VVGVGAAALDPEKLDEGLDARIGVKVEPVAALGGVASLLLLGLNGYPPPHLVNSLNNATLCSLRRFFGSRAEKPANDLRSLVRMHTFPQIHWQSFAS